MSRLMATVKCAGFFAAERHSRQIDSVQHGASDMTYSSSATADGPRDAAYPSKSC